MIEDRIFMQYSDGCLSECRNDSCSRFLRSPTFIYSDAATVCGGEGRGKHSAKLLCPGKSKTNDQLAEGGGGARHQRKIHGENGHE